MEIGYSRAERVSFSSLLAATANSTPHVLFHKRHFRVMLLNTDRSVE